MRLSEAIRLGAMLRPQAYGELHTNPGSGHKASTCALGAALEATGHTYKKVKVFPAGSRDRQGNDVSGESGVQLRGDWPENWKETFRTMVCNPETGVQMMLHRVITDLNDVHRWTREKIADWVQTQEDARSAISREPLQEVGAQIDKLVTK